MCLIVTYAVGRFATVADYPMRGIRLASVDGLIELVMLLVLHWCIGAVTFFALLLSLVLAALIPAFTGGYAIVLVILGFGAGLLWNSSSESAGK